MGLIEGRVENIEIEREWRRLGEIGIERDRRDIGLREIGRVVDIVFERMGDIGIVRDRRDIGIEREMESGGYWD